MEINRLLIFLSIIFSGASYSKELVVKYASPSSYDSIPDNVKEYFTSYRCVIPQVLKNLYGPGIDNKPFNGDFDRDGTQDRVALCSRGGVSSIVVMWGGKSECPSVFGAENDSSSYEGMGELGHYYSRQVFSGDGLIAQYDYISKGDHVTFTCLNGRWDKKYNY